MFVLSSLEPNGDVFFIFSHSREFPILRYTRRLCRLAFIFSLSLPREIYLFKENNLRWPELLLFVLSFRARAKERLLGL